MAGRITELTARTTIQDTDLAEIVGDVATTPDNFKITHSNKWLYYKAKADTVYQPLDGDLTSIAALTTTAYGRALLTQADEAALKATINLEIGTDVQAYSANLATWSAVAPSVNGQSLVAAANYAAMRTLLDLEPGTDFYSISAANAAFAAISHTHAATDITSGTFENARIAVGNVTQHQASLSITESQISDLGSYETADADILKADVGDVLTAGYTSDSYSGGTVSSGTYTPAPATSQENFQHYTNNGAHTLAPPASPCAVVVEITNGASAGAITTSGFTVVDGDAFTTTNAEKFMCFITKTTASSYLSVKALQ